MRPARKGIVFERLAFTATDLAGAVTAAIFITPTGGARATPVPHPSARAAPHRVRAPPAFVVTDRSKRL